MKILIVGDGRMGRAITHLLSSCSDYEVIVADQFIVNSDDKSIKKIKLDIEDEKEFDVLLIEHHFDAIISSLPYYHNCLIARKARQYQLHYFDLTEDVKTTESIAEIARNADTVFMPQCGLAPGFINIIASHLMQDYDSIESVFLRAGDLPVNSSNALHYALTWSTDGLINQYANLCEVIIDGRYSTVEPLEGLEEIVLNGIFYEAFNTSGGLGTLWKSYVGKIKNMNYKTLRYPGHCEKIKFLMNDLHLNQHRDTLKKILEESILETTDDKVVIHVAVTGTKKNHYCETSYTKELYSKTINGYLLTAIQLATASGVCAVVHTVLQNKNDLRGFVTQEQFPYSDFISNQFGKYYE